jgi:hypothetical protein
MPTSTAAELLYNGGIIAHNDSCYFAAWKQTLVTSFHMHGMSRRIKLKPHTPPVDESLHTISTYIYTFLKKWVKEQLKMVCD